MESIVIFANENLSLQNLFAVAGFYRRTFPSRLYAGSFRHAMRAAPLQREAFTANVVTLVLLYCKQFCFRTSRPLSRSLPALALLAAPPHFPLAPSATLRVPPPSRREAFTANVVTLVLLSQAVLLSHFSPALVPSACSCAPCRPRTSPPAPSVTLRVSPPSRRETLTKSQRWLWAEKQRIICFSRGVVQRNKAHVMRLVSVLCHAVFGLGGGYTMRLSIKKRMRVLRGKIRCKNGRM